MSKFMEEASKNQFPESVYLANGHILSPPVTQTLSGDKLSLPELTKGNRADSHLYKM